MTTGTTHWIPPTLTERLLYEAKTAGDREAQLALLSRATLFLPVGRLHADTPGAGLPLVPAKDPQTRKRSIAAFTVGMLPPWHPEWVCQATTLAELARHWPDGRKKASLAVNPGTPCAIGLEAGPRHRAAWAKAAAATGGPPRGLLLTHAHGPTQGALAHGLACGAHLSVHNSVPWNQLGTTLFGYESDVGTLRGTWRVTNRGQYRDKLAVLFRARLCGLEESAALRARTVLAARLGRTPTTGEWLDTVLASLTERGADEATLKELTDTVTRISRYEARFRADGVLGTDERVDSLAAFDYGRVVSFVRMGLGARLCEPHEAEEAILTAGRLSREAYPSWEAFSVAYALARVIAFDEDRFGRVYQESLGQHRILTQDPASPYRSVPWK
ncbi:DUF1266 domain-containing protein [Streptomyces sp. NPDC003036]|uniref:DUF1266 domain-containing protein n=1 Tax=Streptomyces sp. NPDC003036 TaxID=3154442 RepID=UPI0033AF5CE3